MAKHMMHSSNKQTNGGVFALEFVGSLFYLVLVYLMAADDMPVGVVFNGTGSFWLPVFAGVSVIAAIALFVFSFTYLAEPKVISGEHTKNLGLYFAAATGITFTAMTLGTSYFVLAFAGFVLSLIGGMVGYRL
jgi:hypothetical protein